MLIQEKKDIHNRVKAYETTYKKLVDDTIIIPENKELILKFIRDCRLGKTIKNRQKKSIGMARCIKYIQLLSKLSYWLQKPFNDVNQNDMENLIESLEGDKYTYEIKSKSGAMLKSGKYSHSTKLDYKIALKKFYKWFMGNNTHYPGLVDWIETYEIVKEIPTISREDIEEIVLSANIRNRAIIMLLFDSGVRAEEFLNIKLADLENDNGKYKVRIVFSKTKPRTIHIPICSKYLDLWLKEYKYKSDQEYLFPINYNSLRMMLHRTFSSKSTVKVTPHVLRHSSATYYAKFLKQYQLCYRFGWSMSSDMPNRYLDREGMHDEEVPSIVKKEESEKLEKVNQNLNVEVAGLKEAIEELNNKFTFINRKLDNLHNGQDFLQLVASQGLKYGNQV